MKILQSDIDNLLDVCSVLQNVRDARPPCYTREHLCRLLSRTRKVYMLLLCASDGGQQTFRDLIIDGVPDDSNIAVAIRSFASIT